MKPFIFEKNYTRDTSILIQQIWAQQLSCGIDERLGWKNPFLPMIIHYLRNGVVEIWDSSAAREWLEARLLERNLADEAPMLASLETYKTQLLEIKKFWKNGNARTQAEFDEYLKLLPELMFHFNQWYYTVTNPKSPRHLIEMILEIRKDDVFFATNDMFISATLRILHPEIAGVENAVLFEEVSSIPSRKVLEQRLQGAALIDGQELFLGQSDEFAKKYPQYILQTEKVAAGVKTIKGQVAFKGKVSGTVRILRRRDQIDSVKEGDVIVSPMTTPDFMPAMQRAAAFVTDEGGITCHAAIVARELKKPCIIGTKIATSVLKDGDVVEVDAEKGTVTIIK